ncbi:SpaH/EbpB family LPXTG-anchored major pilin [Bifidobacterium felsineum]|uniref:SpaH/EbpB family LPXTG-anchored major pilin n=1 Tax=Bifidobacterium felsineum TaxID=2045440 RepID=UPI001BDBE105|nr:SpaH/EbpB family LPXTG-anchored major pilin [Bifidobacterium felsineum]MBT1164720.1 SpaH/EbpB family LPXTG-anchored major pilin [Bifidobacterium felsineum]
MFRSIRKSWAAIVAVLAMVVGLLGFVSPAQAADVMPQSTGSITVSAVEQGATVHAYKVIDITWDGTNNPTYKWVNQVATWLQSQNDYKGYVGANNAVTDAYLNEGAAKLKTFYKRVADHFKDANALTEAGSAAATGGTAGKADATATISNLGFGSYLTEVTGGKRDYQQNVLNVYPKYNDGTKKWELIEGNADAKSTIANIDKSINEDTNDHVSGKDTVNADPGYGTDSEAIGKDVRFDLRSDVPDLSTGLQPKFFMADTLSDGLTLKPSTIEVYGVNSNGNETKLTANTDYTLTTNNATSPETSAKVSFTVEYVYNQVKGYKRVHVTYKATVNKDAVIGPTGNPNTLDVLWTHNPTDGWHKETDKVKVFTYGLKVVKYGENNQPISGAEFALSDKGSTNYFEVVKISEGVYRRATDTDAAANKTTTLAVDSKGNLTIKGLDEGDYDLTETKAPEGYVKLTSPKSFTIDDQVGSPTVEHNGHVKGESTTLPGYYPLTVTNSKTPTMPTTGSVGTLVFAVAGVLLVAGGLLLALTRKRS